jgi:transcriptional regulator with XRE-family HTH domain
MAGVMKSGALSAVKQELGLTWDQVAKKAGVSKRTLLRLDKGGKEPQNRTLLGLAAALGKAPEDFIDKSSGAALVPVDDRQEGHVLRISKFDPIQTADAVRSVIASQVGLRRHGSIIFRLEVKSLMGRDQLQACNVLRETFSELDDECRPRVVDVSGVSYFDEYADPLRNDPFWTHSAGRRLFDVVQEMREKGLKVMAERFTTYYESEPLNSGETIPVRCTDLYVVIADPSVPFVEIPVEIGTYQKPIPLIPF